MPMPLLLPAFTTSTLIPSFSYAREESTSTVYTPIDPTLAVAVA